MDSAKQMVKAHVIYYLSRGAQLEHPHLIEVQFSFGDGLLLKDVKKRLQAIRGGNMPNCFSWSYKRNYNDGYIWHDVSDDDRISPVRGQEYVLKGSEICDHYREKYVSPVNGVVHPSLKSAENFPGDYEMRQNLKSSTTKESNLIYEKLVTNEVYHSGQTSNRSSFSKKGNTNSDSALSVNRQVMETLSQAKSDPQECVVDEFSGDNIFSDESSTQNYSAVKGYKISSSPILIVERGKDAVETGNEGSFAKYKSKAIHQTFARGFGGSTFDSKPTSLSEPYQEVQQPSPVQSTTFSESSDTRKKVSKIVPSKPHYEENSTGKLKQATSSTVLRQLLSCGGIETKQKSSSSEVDSEADTNVYLTVEEPTPPSHVGQNWSWRKPGLKTLKVESKSVDDTQSETRGKDQIQFSQVQIEESQRCSSETIKLWQSNVSPTRTDHLTNAPAISDAPSIDTPLQEKRNERILKVPVNHYSCQRESFARRSLDFSTKDEVKMINKEDNNKISTFSPMAYCRQEENKAREANKAEEYTENNVCDSRMSPGYLKSNAKGSKTHNLTSAKDEKDTSPISSAKSQNCPKSSITPRYVPDNEKSNAQSVAPLFEEFSPPKKDSKNRDDRPLTPGRSKLDWEKTFQEAVNACVAPEDFRQVLQECVHCGRTFKPDSLKVHMRGCHDNVRSKHIAIRSTTMSTRRSQ
ncbi:hypothetical protein O6H91_03G092400 [Diphasiastrum complanatum]|uniref:Uncharacterized protein n=2 Tax=Diphasiastrum complanatum TaxID=34168 RepID=A0ACC2E952_DIPCM|nr:hypothetical protein O6H91_03G052300 [Diphasiastrum complanatum]KAJ7563001.1 hypothetical protein O6H91_03G092400 [Diphasiastrum complanatum]